MGTHKGSVSGVTKDTKSVSHGRAEGRSFWKKGERSVCLSGVRKMSRISGFDKSEATRVPNQGSFTAMGEQKPK